VVSDFLSHQRMMMDQTNRLVFRNFSLERIYWLFGHMMRLGSKAITRKGLNQNEIKKMPSKKVNLNFIKEGELDQCRICICPYENEEEIRELPCKHNFHSTCIDIWLVQNSFCPLCRKKLRT
jgi:Ring finger domain